MRAEKQRGTLFRKIQNRLKGLVALALALTLVATCLPGMTAKARMVESYYLVIGESTHAAFLGKGDVYPTTDSGLYSEYDDSGLTYSNSYLDYNEASSEYTVTDNDLVKSGQLKNVGDSIEISVTERTPFYYGKVRGCSGAFKVIYNGQEQQINDSGVEVSHFAIDEGEYTVKLISDDETIKTITIYPKGQEPKDEPGETEVKVNQDETTPETTMEELPEELINSLLTDSEKEAVAAGEKLTLYLEMKDIDSTVSDADKKEASETVKKASNGAQVGMFFDISFYKKIGNNDAVKIEKVPGGLLKLKFKIPDKFKAKNGEKRTFYIIKIHNGVGTIIGQGTGDEVPAETDEFSTYALAYTDGAVGFYSGLKIKKSGSKIKVSWDKVENAAKYEVYAAYCGKDLPKKATKTTTKKSATFNKVGGKKIDFKKNMKIVVAAYDKNGELIGKSISAHIAGFSKPGFTNPSSIKVSKKKMSVAVGKTAKVKASQKLASAGKKLLGSDHAAKFRYRSTDERVATVSANGTITGVSAGACEVYVYTKNGLAAKVSVTVN